MHSKPLFANTSSANVSLQFEFPFVETYRCKEVHFHIRLKETWKHKDYCYNDIEYEVDRRKRSAESRQKAAATIEVIDDLISDEVIPVINLQINKFKKFAHTSNV